MAIWLLLGYFGLKIFQKQQKNEKEIRELMERIETQK